MSTYPSTYYVAGPTGGNYNFLLNSMWLVIGIKIIGNWTDYRGGSARICDTRLLSSNKKRYLRPIEVKKYCHV